MPDVCLYGVQLSGYATFARLSLRLNHVLFKECILPNDEDLVVQYQKRTEQVLKKVVMGVVIMTLVIIVGAFFV